MDSIAKLISSIGQKAKNSSNTLRVESTDIKNSALLNIASEIQQNQDIILDANNKDLIIAKKRFFCDAYLPKCRPSRDDGIYAECILG